MVQIACSPSSMTVRVIPSAHTRIHTFWEMVGVPQPQTTTTTMNGATVDPVVQVSCFVYLSMS